MSAPRTNGSLYATTTSMCVLTAAPPTWHSATQDAPNSGCWACTHSRQCQVAGCRGHISRWWHHTKLWHGTLCCWCACAPDPSRPADGRQDAAVWAGDGGWGLVVGAALSSACQYGVEGLHLCLLLGACLAQRGQDVGEAVEAVELRQEAGQSSMVWCYCPCVLQCGLLCCGL